MYLNYLCSQTCRLWLSLSFACNTRFISSARWFSVRKPSPQLCFTRNCCWQIEMSGLPPDGSSDSSDLCWSHLSCSDRRLCCSLLTPVLPKPAVLSLSFSTSWFCGCEKHSSASMKPAQTNSSGPLFNCWGWTNTFTSWVAFLSDIFTVNLFKIMGDLVSARGDLWIPLQRPRLWFLLG